ncbi:hypothetical protein PGT21_004538 [Puccinia graminis f. sp. tritici]|uniref:Uncharacterized protein n=1 Tax=Puccinia graminis f. sp. tritici TaxID=56615 RepID=A0A5B0M1F9_PUCGR|nr:hypothetical protein PGTUg99_010156 [Puccinia graminis f. sp. tritici]KAA1099355.1 hypothetical protein PGT21_004538 [Puccinia graminis f. sp. tritici]
MLSSRLLDRQKCSSYVRIYTYIFGGRHKASEPSGEKFKRVYFYYRIPSGTVTGAQQELYVVCPWGTGHSRRKPWRRRAHSELEASLAGAYREDLPASLLALATNLTQVPRSEGLSRRSEPPKEQRLASRVASGPLSGGFVKLALASNPTSCGRKRSGAPQQYCAQHCSRSLYSCSWWIFANTNDQHCLCLCD